MQMSDRMRLLGRGWEESLTGASEKPPAMPEDIYYFNGLLFLNFETIKKSSTDLTGIFLFFYQRKIKRFR
ncbi:hypothetical protein [Salmonella enterica]|uniref:hypothetical protein n=1 Tax=Salmonella enterica TaxID=28901 RepID=UPI000EFD2E06|nr:hypothetical protein [Salmonella enterica]